VAASPGSGKARRAASLSAIRLFFGLLFFVLGLGFFLYFQNDGHPWIGAIAWIGATLIGLVDWPNKLVAQHETLSYEKNPDASEDEIWDLDPVRVVRVELPREQAYNVAIAGVRKLIGGLIKEENRETGVIRSWTWDARLRISVTALTRNSSEIKIESRARRLQLLDDGKNLHNVLQLVRWVEENAPTAKDEPAATLSSKREPLDGG
jgi:hypothetical protein